MQRRLLLFSVFVLLWKTFFAQQYTFTNYTEEQGLASGTIRGMFKDTAGYLWLGSEEGISRFDGYNFKIFHHNPDDSTSMPDNSGSMGGQLANGDIWFQFLHGLRLYEPKKLSFTNQFPYKDSTYLIFYSFLMKNDSNALYIGWYNGLVRVKNSACSYFPLPVKTGRARNITASDSSGVIMLCLAGKIFAFNTSEKKYEQVSVADRSGNPDTTVFDIFYSATEKTFTAISPEHLYRFSRKQNKFISVLDLQQLPLIGSRLPNSDYRAMLGVPFFNIYYFAFTDDGNLYQLNMKTGEEKIIHLNTKIPEEEIKDKSIALTAIDKNGILWIATYGMGLFRFNILTDKCEQFINNPGDPASIPSNTVDYVLPDESGLVWFACNGHGLVKMESVVPLMETQSPAVSKSKIVSGGYIKNIRSFLETESGYLVGTLGGLYDYDASKKEFSEWADLFEQGKNIVGTLAKDTSGNIWVGSWTGQLYIINPKNNKHLSLYLPNSNGQWFQIRDLFCDNKNTMWIATNSGGIYTVNVNEIDFDNPASVKFNPVLHNEKDASSISSNVVFTITEDAEGNIWAGADNGLNCFKRSAKKWIHYTNIPGDASSIHGNTVRSFVFDKNGTLWVGTNGGGLNRYNKSENNFTHFTMANGLPNDAIYSIVCDNSGMLWLGTNRGLCRFNPENYSCTNFTLKDGIQNYEFNTGASIKLKDGTLLIGGVEGYNIIHPDKIEINKAPAPKVVVSSIKSFDREVPPGDGSLTLNHTENSLTFQFAALSFYRNQDNKYAYKLEPINTEWIFCNDRKLVSYSNLEPGDYIFKVKACNSDGVWNETGTQLSITITPPWWKTWWFRSLIGLITVSGIFWFFRNRTASLRKQKVILESTVEQRTADLVKQKEIAEQLQSRAEQSEQFKQQFLANMSHEIRTPMNAVMGMTELVLNSDLNERQRKYLETVKKSSGNLLHIINDILDLSKIEAGKIELENIHFSLKDLVQQVVDLLRGKAKERNLHLLSEVDPKIPEVLIGDPLRLTQVLMNLTGNAIKFTEKGSVMIEVKSMDDNRVRFSVIDTGIGIPGDKLSTVFESFSQAHSSDSRKYGGTGLGLSISRQLTGLMGGQLSVESAEDRGTTFFFDLNLPAGSKENLLKQSSLEEIDGSILNGLKILLVDDNPDNRVVAGDLLRSKCDVQIEEAANGQEAVDLLARKDFDIVLMDVQMPVMDGYMATREIRNSRSIVRSHDVPVIALTASVIRSDLDKCRDAGMNDYVPKPFKVSQLISAIAKLTGREIKFSEGRKSESKILPTIHTDLSYLHEFCEGDSSRMHKYIDIYLESAPSFMEKLNVALAADSFMEIATQVHGFKAKFMMMGMDQAVDLAAVIEAQCRSSQPDSSIREDIIHLIKLTGESTNNLRDIDI